MSSPLAMTLLLAWFQACGTIYGVEPDFAWAVARVESGLPGGPEIRCGPLGRCGKYYGPMGINRCFKTKWPIDDPYVNVEVGVKALRGADKRRVLQRYNAAFNESYYRAVMAIYHQARRGRKFHGQIQARNAG